MDRVHGNSFALVSGHPDRNTKGSSEVQAPDAGDWVRSYADELLRFTLTRVKERSVAEDLVQITFIAAWEARERFAGKSSLRTWLFSILRNKIADHYRKSYRDPMVHSDQDELIERYNGNDHWLTEHRPTDWMVIGPDRETLLHEALEHCLDRLPDHWRAAIELKYMKGSDPAVICQELGITTTNYWQQIHRAKVRLRDCISQKLKERNTRSL